MRTPRHVWNLALLIALLLGLLAVWVYGRDDLRPDPDARVGVDERVGWGWGARARVPTGAAGPAGAPARGEPSASPELDPSTPRVRGRVVEPELGPLSEGRIDVVCGDGQRRASARIDEDGQFVAPRCDPGPSCLRLVHPGADQPAAWVIEADADGPALVTVELEARTALTLAGVVVDPEGEAVANASVLVDRGGELATGRSDADGEVLVALPRPRPCDLCDPRAPSGRCQVEPAAAGEPLIVFVSAPGLAAIERRVDADAGPLRLVLDRPAPALRGRVLGREGRAFDARTRVLAHHLERDYERHAAHVDADGEFTFESLAAGEYSLRAIRDERELASLAAARPGERVTLQSQLAAIGGALTIEIVDGEGEAIPGIRVDGGPFRAAVSDREGRVEATQVLPGAYTLRLRRADCAATRVAIELEADSPGWTREVQLSEQC